MSELSNVSSAEVALMQFGTQSYRLMHSDYGLGCQAFRLNTDGRFRRRFTEDDFGKRWDECTQEGESDSTGAFLPE